MLRNALSWPIKFIDSTFDTNNHNGISHPRSALNGKVENESVEHWSNRIITCFEYLRRKFKYVFIFLSFAGLTSSPVVEC